MADTGHVRHVNNKICITWCTRVVKHQGSCFYFYFPFFIFTCIARIVVAAAGVAASASQYCTYCLTTRQMARSPATVVCSILAIGHSIPQHTPDMFCKRFTRPSAFSTWFVLQKVRQSTAAAGRPAWAVKASTQNSANGTSNGASNGAAGNAGDAASAPVSSAAPFAEKSSSQFAERRSSNHKTIGDVFPRDLGDAPPVNADAKAIDWSNSFHGIGTTQLTQRQIDILLQPLDSDDIEIKPDGLIYLPEIKYRRILNKSLGPGSWGLIPRGATIVTPKLITREYALVVMGKLISVARGEQDYFNEQGIPTATEGCKSNALMRCCKDLGIGSELWDPRFIRGFKKQYCEQVGVTHVSTGKRKVIWKRKDAYVEYPWKK